LIHQELDHVYITSDSKKFLDKQEAIDHEEVINFQKEQD